MRNGVRMCRKVLTTLTRPMVMPRPNTIGRNFMPRRSDQMNSSSIGQPTIISLVRGRMTSVFSRKLRNASSVLEVVAELPDNLCYMLVNGDPREAISVEFTYEVGSDGLVHQTQIDVDVRTPDLLDEDFVWVEGMFNDFLK